MKRAQFRDPKHWHERHWREHPPTAPVPHAGWALALCAGHFVLPGARAGMRGGTRLAS